MDKNKIKALRNGNLPRDVWRNTLCNVLEEIVNEIPDRDIDNLNAELEWRFATTEPLVMEQFCKWKDLDRKRTINFGIGFGPKPILSFAKAIKILKRDGRSIRHESWPVKWALVPRWYGNGIKFFDGVGYSPEFKLTTNMLDTGWIVLDR